MSNDQSDSELPGFDDLANDFVEQGAFGSPSELHGLLCGQLGAGGRYSEPAWLNQCLELIGATEAPSEEMREDLLQMYRASLLQLEGSSFDFTLLLPEENVTVSQRAQALGQWCHGFLSGFTLGGGRIDQGLSEDARDAMTDFAQIAQIAEDDDATEENEADYFEVYEYVRMAALLVFSECNRVPDSDPGIPPGTPIH